MKPYYDHGGITIYHGDCREILPSLGKFDLLLTDPPYGTGHSKSYASAKRSRIHKGACRAVPKDYPEIEGDDAPFDPSHLSAVAPARILWGANHYADRLPASSFWLCWDRQCGLGSGTITDCELAWTVGTTFKTVRMFRHLWAGYNRASEAGELALHPTQKPVALMSWCLGFFPEAKTVVDPYMGSGPVAKACKDRGLRYVGIELVEKYCEIAAKRLAQEVLFA
ncbi:MAG TPA: DNA methyltransferase [Polyangiaceae bacterium]|nr:DNA methyltransferase [Polyangiaceae bacterium]